MAIRLHGSSRTTPRIRAERQLATGSHRSLAKLYGINPKTAAKWRARTSVLDEPMAPRDKASQHLSQEQEHLEIALRKQGHLSLDDLMGQLLETAPRLSRSALHRCLQRHGISRQPATQVPRRHGKFEETTLGFVPIDSAEMKISSGRQHMFVAIDRVTKFTQVAFFDRATKANAAQFLRQVLVASRTAYLPLWRTTAWRSQGKNASEAASQAHASVTSLNASASSMEPRNDIPSRITPGRTAWSSA